MPIMNINGFISKNKGVDERFFIVLALTMQVFYARYFLEFKHPFGLSSGIRKGTDSVIVKICKDGFTGYGEATLPPYLSENQQTVIDFLKSCFNENSLNNTSVCESIRHIHQFQTGNFAAKCALESAYLHWYCQANNTTIKELFKIPSGNDPECTFTLGVSESNEIKDKLNEGEGFPVLKIKLDGKNDREIINSIRTHTRKPLCVDVNQGWNDLAYAIEMSHWLKEKNVLLIEQPFSKYNIDLHAKFREESALPIVADESVQHFEDLQRMGHAFSGINIKLIKCGGLSQAVLMAEWCKLNKKMILIGCMSESSCGVFHSSVLEGFADMLDLDGPYLIKNDPFSGFEINDGKCKRSLLKLKNKLNFIPL